MKSITSLSLLLIVSVSACSTDSSNSSAPDAGETPPSSSDDASSSEPTKNAKDSGKPSPTNSDAGKAVADEKDGGQTSQNESDAAVAATDAATPMTTTGCSLANDEFGIVAKLDGSDYEYSDSASVVAVAEDLWAVTVGQLERWRLHIPPTPGTYACGTTAGEVSIERLGVTPPLASSFDDRTSCSIKVESVDGFIRGSFEGTLITLAQELLVLEDGCFNVPNGGTLGGDPSATLPSGAGASLNVSQGNELIGDDTAGTLALSGSGDQRAMEQWYANFAGEISTPPTAAEVRALGLPYAAGTFNCGESPKVGDQTLFAAAQLSIHLAGVIYAGHAEGGNCTLTVSGGDPDFTVDYDGVFVSEDRTIEASGQFRFPNPKVQ